VIFESKLDLKCVHNVDFQALWRCLHNTPDSTANVAFRVLGKFGGSNRKMLPEAQKVIIAKFIVFYICIFISRMTVFTSAHRLLRDGFF